MGKHVDEENHEIEESVSRKIILAIGGVAPGALGTILGGFALEMSRRKT